MNCWSIGQIVTLVNHSGVSGENSAFFLNIRIRLITGNMSI